MSNFTDFIGGSGGGAPIVQHLYTSGDSYGNPSFTISAVDTTKTFLVMNTTMTDDLWASNAARLTSSTSVGVVISSTNSSRGSAVPVTIEVVEYT